MVSRRFLTVLLLGLAASMPAAELTRAQQEEFLRTAEVVATRPAGKGVTGVLRATLRSQDGGFTHDASIQRIDEWKKEFKGTRGSELNFRDTWKFNVAAYRLSLLLGLDMVPATVERPYGGMSGAFTWWVDGVLMDEEERQKQKIDPPNPEDFHQQYFIMQIFDQLIYNIDRNLGNLLITKGWKIWLIDHGRAFRQNTSLLRPESLKRCDRNLLARMRALDEATLKREIGDYVLGAEIRALLKRRDRIVAFFDHAGESALFDSHGVR